MQTTQFGLKRITGLKQGYFTCHIIFSFSSFRTVTMAKFQATSHNSYIQCILNTYLKCLTWNGNPLKLCIFFLHA